MSPSISLGCTSANHYSFTGYRPLRSKGEPELSLMPSGIAAHCDPDFRGNLGCAVPRHITGDAHVQA
jgi:hypothetical protein